MNTRINIDNTTTSGVYETTNGFPVSVKEISIDAATMKCNLRVDNKKSAYELQQLDDSYPDDPSTTDEQSTRIYTKYDINRDEAIV